MNRPIKNTYKLPLILIIDYNAVMSSNIKEHIDSESYEMEILYDSRYVFENVNLINPDLILLNKDMSDYDRFEICKLLKNIPNVTNTPIIMILDSYNSHDIKQTFESGASDYLCKPINIVELNYKLKNHLKYNETQKNEKQLSKYIIDMNSKIKHLAEIIPTCSYCKKVRDENDQWLDIELYITKHIDTKFSHGICPDCLKENYPDCCDEFLIKKESI